MNAHVGTFAMRSGTGTQVVPVPFEAKALMFFGLGTLNTLMHGDGGFRDAAMIGTGFADGTVNMGESSSDAAGFGARFICGGSSGAYSIIAVHTQAAFGGNMVLQAAVTSISATDFTITYTTNDTSDAGVYPFFVPGQSFMFVALGGDDLLVDMGLPNGSGIATTIGFPLKGLISRIQTLGPGGGTATGAGAGGAGQVGWTTDAGVQGCVATYLAGYTTIYAYHATDRVTADLTAGGTVSNGQIGTLTATTFTASNYAGSYLAVGGTGVLTASGAVTQAASAGNQTINLGINAKVVLFATAGTLTSEAGVVQEGSFQFNLGAATPTGIASLWCGEINTSSAAPLGARYVSDESLLRFGTPNGASTSFTSVVDSVTLNTTGTADLNWATSDGSQRAILWFAIGEEAEELGTVEVNKVWIEPAAGQVTLQLGTTAGGDDIGTQLTGAAGAAPLTLGPISVPVGTYYVGETNAYLWLDTISGTNNGEPITFGANNSFTVANGDVVVITISNAEIPLPEQIKQWQLYRLDLKPRQEETG